MDSGPHGRPKPTYYPHALGYSPLTRGLLLMVPCIGRGPSPGWTYGKWSSLVNGPNGWSTSPAQHGLTTDYRGGRLLRGTTNGSLEGFSTAATMPLGDLGAGGFSLVTRAYCRDPDAATANYNSMHGFGSFNPGFYWDGAGGSDRLQLYHAGDVLTGHGISDPGWYTIAFTRSGTGANEGRAYVNGAAVGTTFTWSATFTNERFVFGNQDVAGAFNTADADYEYVAMVDHQLSPAEAKAWHEDPWQVFPAVDADLPLITEAAPAAGRIMSSLVAHGGLAGQGGIAGIGGGLAG